MIKRLLALLFVLFTPLPASASPVVPMPASTQEEALPSPYFMDLTLVEYVRCNLPNGNWMSGSGVRIDSDLVLTALHVIGSPTCTVGGVLTPPEPATLVFADGTLDYAVLRVASHRASRIEINCDGFKPGETYMAFGYPYGSQFAALHLIGTAAKVGFAGPFRGLSILRGTVYHGVSGGAVVDSEGRVTGIVNAMPEGEPQAWSRALKDTYLCAKPGAAA